MNGYHMIENIKKYLVQLHFSINLISFDIKKTLQRILRIFSLYIM